MAEPTAAGAEDEMSPQTEDHREMVRDLWKEVLEHDRFGDDDSWFHVGGNSLGAAILVGKLSRRFGQRLTLRPFLEQPTVSQLVKVLDEQAQAAPK